MFWDHSGRGGDGTSKKALTLLFTKPQDFVPPAGMISRDRSPIEGQWKLFSVLQGMAGDYGAGGSVNSTLNTLSESVFIGKTD